MIPSLTAKMSPVCSATLHRDVLWAMQVVFNHRVALPEPLTTELPTPDRAEGGPSASPDVLGEQPRPMVEDRGSRLRLTSTCVFVQRIALSTTDSMCSSRQATLTLSGGPEDGRRRANGQRLVT
jgi:hypothetical protein